MTNTVFVLVVCDRHTDPQVTFYADVMTAIEAARAATHAYGWVEDELTDAMVRSRWHYAAHHPHESDSLHVVATEIVG